MLGFLAALAATTSLVPDPVARWINIPAVKQVWCDHAAGTAFVANGMLISVAHVTSNPNCAIGGVPLFSLRLRDRDFSVSGSAPVRGFKINCGGFKPGESYYAIGYANALPLQRVITLRGTGEIADNGMAVLWGAPTVIPGMSGGPIINSHAEVVGTVNMFDLSWPVSLSVQMRDTPLCRS